ncbi:uncharacterized protein BJX67DRAFT_114163 [Aspergillus lucknowensis]|uniref:Uncharacterized protein n=1 Tax=Aspergillus lucknowensis TaxID=176173 RepID=A0ABR4LRD9_9EURO
MIYPPHPHVRDNIPQASTHTQSIAPADQELVWLRHDWAVQKSTRLAQEQQWGRRANDVVIGGSMTALGKDSKDVLNSQFPQNISSPVPCTISNLSLPARLNSVPSLFLCLILPSLSCPSLSFGIELPNPSLPCLILQEPGALLLDLKNRYLPGEP